MARALYRRTFQTRPYETKVVELELGGETSTVADLAKEATPENLRRLAKVYADMESVGDQIMAQALAKPDPGGRRD